MSLFYSAQYVCIDWMDPHLRGPIILLAQSTECSDHLKGYWNRKFELNNILVSPMDPIMDLIDQLFIGNVINLFRNCGTLILGDSLFD